MSDPLSATSISTDPLTRSTTIVQTSNPLNIFGALCCLIILCCICCCLWSSLGSMMNPRPVSNTQMRPIPVEVVNSQQNTNIPRAQETFYY